MALSSQQKIALKWGVGVGLAILVIVTIVLAVTLSAKNATPPTEPIKFEEFLSNEFESKPFSWSLSPISKKIYVIDDFGNLVSFNVESFEEKIVVTATDMTQLGTFVAAAPNNEKLLLFANSVEPLWRQSTFALYSVWNTDSRSSIEVDPKDNDDAVKLRYVQWIPNSGHLIYVHENNIFMKKDLNDNSQDSKLTTDGTNTIYNGIPSWVYEEEVLLSDNAIYFSPNGQQMAFLQFNENNVKSITITKYGDPDKPKKNQYPTDFRLKYPKTGDNNPEVKLIILPDLDEVQKITEIGKPADFDEFTICSAVTWIDDSSVVAIWMNRLQVKGAIIMCTKNGDNWPCKYIYRQNEEDGWLDLFQPPVFNTRTKMLLIQPHKDDTDDLTYKHLALITDLDNNPTTTFLSNGAFTVTSILGWDTDKEMIYFVGSKIGEPGSRHLYKVSSAVSESPNIFECVSCSLSWPNGIRCQYNEVVMAEDFKHYLHNCYGPSVPQSVFRSTFDNDIVHVFEDNRNLSASLQRKSQPRKMKLAIDVEGGFKAQVLLTLPRKYDKNAQHQYPLLVHVYGGPGSQMVDAKWSVGWREFLVTNYDIVYAQIDGRGSGFQSNEFLFQLKNKLGTFEVEDQINVTKTLLERFTFLDPDRTGIWGWSYGGYATLMALSKDSGNVLKCGISVSPPTDWLLYDSIYTERYMGTADVEVDPEYLAKYESSSLLGRAEELRGKTFMLNHGVADDNVHYQNTMLFSRALQLADVNFQEFSYSDENHSLKGVTQFLYHRFDDFWAQCFDYESVIAEKSSQQEE